MTRRSDTAGCDAVVMHERTRPHDDGVLVLETEVKTGQNLLRRGKEMRAGDVVVARGSILEPARLGILAAVGRTEVMVVPRPQVAIAPTGDELVEPGQVPGHRPDPEPRPPCMLNALVDSRRAPGTRVLLIAPDEPGPLGQALGAAG